VDEIKGIYGVESLYMKKWVCLWLVTASSLVAAVPLVYATSQPTVAPVPTASFNHSPITSLHADAVLSGTASGLKTLGASVTATGAKKPVYTNNSISLSSSTWNIAVSPPLGAGTYVVTLFSGTTTLATSTLTVGLRSIPTIQSVTTLPLYDVADGKLMRFSVHAGNTGPVAMEQISFLINAENATVSDVGLYGFSDSGFTTPFIASTTATTSLNSVLVTPTGPTFAIVPDALIEIPKDATYYFELDGTVTPTDTTYSVDTTLLGDHASDINTAAAEASSSNLVWSPNTYGTSQTTDQDWLNGDDVSMPRSGIIQGREGTPIPVLPTCSLDSNILLLLPNQPVSVNWTSTDATYATWSDGVSGGVSGSRTFSSLSASKTFVLTVYGPYGSAACSVNVGVPLPPKAVATSTPDSLAVTPSSGPTPLATKFTAVVNNAKSCSALTYSVGYGDGTATSTISVAKNVCAAQTSTFSHTYTKAGTFIAGLYQSTGTSSSQIIQKLTIVVGVKTSFLLDTKTNLASVASAASGIVHAFGMYFTTLFHRFTRK